MDPVHDRGSMDPVQRRGPWTPGPCFVLTHQLSGTRAVVTIAREHSRISGLPYLVRERVSLAAVFGCHATLPANKPQGQ